MQVVKQAIYEAIAADVTLQGRIGGQFFFGRIPARNADDTDVEISTTRGVVVLTGETIVVSGPGARERQTYTFTIESLSHDLCESIFSDLDRLFHTIARYVWVSLDVPAGQAIIRKEFAGDFAEPGSERVSKAVRYTVLYAPAYS